MMLEGLLVDLVPFGDRFKEHEHRWENGEAAFWGDMGYRQVITQRAIKERQEERAGWSERPNSPVAFGIQTKDGTPIGAFFVAGINPYNRVAMFGALIGEPDYWGGGYGTDALLLVVDYCFEWMDLRKVWLMTMSLNARVMRQMEKAGFTLEGRRRESTVADKALHDVLYYGLLREEWPGRLAMVERLGLKAKFPPPGH